MLIVQQKKGMFFIKQMPLQMFLRAMEELNSEMTSKYRAHKFPRLTKQYHNKNYKYFSV